MNSIKAVCFDLDGTLLDRKSSLVDFAWWQVNGMLTDEIIDKDLFVKRFLELDANGTVWKDRVYASLVKEFSINNWSVSELLQSYELAFCGFCRPYPNVVEIVSGLHRDGYLIGLISNGKWPFQQHCFRALGMSHLFSSVVISEQVGYRKPDPEIFRLACKALSVPPCNSVFVGDNPTADVEGATSAGLFAVLMSHDQEKIYPGTESVCTDFRLLPAMFTSIVDAR